MEKAEEGLVHVDMEDKNKKNVMWWLIRCVLLLLMLKYAGSAGVDASLWRSEELKKVSAVIIPGFACTRLRSWSILNCPFSPLDFNPLDPVWIDVRKLLSVPQCWMKCMVLDPLTQADHPECKARPDSGVAAITELDPGYITGPLTSVWKAWVAWCVEFGVDPEAVVAAPYDWRLAGPVLEERDLYFHRLRLTFETCRKLRGGPALVFAHSLGNNVFRYFLEWLKQEIAPKDYTNWLNDHIFTYHAIGALYLGAPEGVKAILSGLPNGLPISEGAARVMLNTFSSGLWMIPFSENCHTMDVCSHTMSSTERVVHCTEKEYSSDTPGWPVNILEVDMPVSPGPSSATVPIEKDALAQAQRSYSAERISDGTVFKELGEIDPQAEVSFHQLQK